MTKFDPEWDCWPLQKAVMHTAFRDLLAVIRRDMQELRARGVLFDVPDWWAEELAPPAASHDRRDCSIQELVETLQCLLGAVQTRFLHDLYEGKLSCWGRPGSSLAQYERAPAWAVIPKVESWWMGGGILRLQSGELFYTARVEPPAPRRMIPESEIEEWLRGHPEMSARDGLPAACRDLRGKIPRSRFRAVRNRLGISLPAGRK